MFFRRCVECYSCGSKQAGKNCLWQNNYSQCGVCASKAKCFVCDLQYHEEDTIIQVRNTHSFYNLPCGV